MASKQLMKGKRENAFARDPESVTIVGYDTDEGPEAAGWDERVELIDETITEEWIATFLRLGCIEPVVVRKNGAERVDVVDGRRRVLGLRAANKLRVARGEKPFLITCVAFKGTDKGSYEAMVVTNEGRFNDEPITKARKMARYQQLHKATDNDLTIVFQMSLVQVRQHLALLDLADPVQEQVASRKLAVNTALTLRDLPRSEQVTEAKELIESKATVAEAREKTKVRKARARGEAVPEPAPRALLITPKMCGRLAHDAEFVAGLPVEARHLLQAISGNEQSRVRVKGLVAALRRIEG